MTGFAARWRGLSLWVRDGVLALVVTVVGQVELVLLADEVAGSRPLQHVAFALITGSLVARRARPLGAVVAGAVGLVFQTLIGDAPAVAGFVAILVLTYSVAQYADGRRDAVLGLLAVLAAIESYAFVADEVRVADEFANLAIPVVVWVFARLARERLDRAVAAEREALAAREAVREEERARVAAVAAERRRIAREMHDVVGHGVTLMLLHTDAVQARLAARDPETAAHLDVVLTSGRTALDDLHRLLRVLRETPAEESVSEDPGTLAGVAPLVEAAGPRVGLVVEGGVRPLPAAVEASGYRIVQEALTNALKHAPGAQVQVILRFAERALEVVVEDDGSGGPGVARPGGHGLVGIRERVALFDGRVTAGTRDDGPGWRVRAELPVPAPEPAAV
ncbi:sensor histidine kinase [Blastococcus jejuensis]|uniref:sensor histidine kinase n=1 Tax=Blastococcus jejuensis TaxID=351224 RepID=UPI0031D0D026